MTAGFHRSAQNVAAFLGVLIYATTNLAKADNVSDEIRLLKARLKQLEAKVSQQEQAAKVEKQSRAVEPRAAGATTTATGTTATASLPGLDHFYFKGLEITPGGFFAAESVYRSHWMGADNNTPFQNIPFGFIPGAHLTEWRATARPSRPNVMFKADIDKQTHIMAFAEVDFLGAAQTANSNESNSYNLRLRQAYGNLDFDAYGLHVAGGQMWSLVTMNSVGIRPDTSLQPLTIDHQYLPGYVWARTPGFRITKDFDKQFWAAFSVESSSATFALPGAPVFGTSALPLFGTPVLLSLPAAGGLFNPSNPYPFARLPDMIGKVAWDGSIADRKISR